LEYYYAIDKIKNKNILVDAKNIKALALSNKFDKMHLDGINCCLFLDGNILVKIK